MIRLLRRALPSCGRRPCRPLLRSLSSSLLPATETMPYKGVMIDLTSPSASSLASATDAAVAAELAQALDAWIAAGCKSAWVRLPTDRASLVPVAAALGFDFHHAGPGYCVLKRWLRPDEEDKVHMHGRGTRGKGGIDGGGVLEYL